MTPSSPPQDLATQWKLACRLYPIYFEIAREFVIDVAPNSVLAAGGDMPDAETATQAAQWIEKLDQNIQAHQFRQFLQTSSMVAHDGLGDMLQYFLARPSKNEIIRDKVDFLLVQYFSQVAPSKLDEDVDLAQVAQALDQILGSVELKAPVWLNALDRVLDSARRCRSLDELLHGGVLEQGRKVKIQAGDLFFLPVALVAFGRYGYLMRRVFFRLMHGDLNAILDGLDQLDDKGIETIDCRRAQFSEHEPILRLRMICQSWKVLFQAEYSSGQPLRMLVDLRASVESALGKGASAQLGTGPSPGEAKAAAAGAPGIMGTTSESRMKPRPVPADAPEFEVTASTEWDADAGSPPKKKK